MVRVLDRHTEAMGYIHCPHKTEDKEKGMGRFSTDTVI